MQELYLRFYFIICVITFVVQIFALTKMKKEKIAKYWNIFVGVTVANLVFVGIMYVILANSAMGLNGAVACWMVCGLALVINAILLGVGWLIKRSCKNKKIKLNKTVMGMGGLVLGLNVLVILGLPALISFITFKTGEAQVINYLKNRYGDGNYEVVNVYEEYVTEGMWNEYLAGYDYEIKSDYVKGTFMVSTDKGNHVEDDYFLPVYFSQQNNLNYDLKYGDYRKRLNYNFREFDDYIEEVAKSKYGTELKIGDAQDIYKNYIYSGGGVNGVEYNENYYIVPANNGKIPSVEEVVEGLVK